MQQENSPFLNYYVFLYSLQFLSLKDIFSNLARVNRRFNEITSCRQFLGCLLIQRIKIFIGKQPLEDNVNSIHPIKEQYSDQELKILVTTMKDRPYELPFWGYKTNGGLAFVNLRYWIGKTFSKSLNQMIATKITSPNIFIEGGVCQDIVDFKNHVYRMAEILQNFQHNDQQNQLRGYRDTMVPNVFAAAFQLDQILSENPQIYQNEFNHLLETFQEALQPLRAYVQAMYSTFSTQLVTNPNTLYKEPQILNNINAIVQKFKISRVGKFLSPIKTLLIVGSMTKFQKVDESFEKDMGQAKSLQKAINFVFKYPQYQIDKIQENGTNTITFQRPKNNIKQDYYPILWFSFENSKILKKQVILSESSTVIANFVRVLLIEFDECLCENPDMTLSGGGLGYIQIKGYALSKNGDKFEYYR